MTNSSTIDYGEVSDSTKLYQLIMDLLDAYRANIEQAEAVAQGDLLRAATYSANQWELRWKGAALSLVLMLPDHWKYIEEGRGPTHNSEGGALYPAILKWIKVKRIVPRPDPKTHKVPSAKSLAYAITKKIHREGYFSPGHHGKYPLKNAIEQTDIVNNFATALADQFNRVIRVELGQILRN